MANGAPTVSNGLVISGITTTSEVNVGQGVTFSTVGNATFSGIVTATSFVGSGADLTGITQTTINSNAANRIITGSGSANTLEGNSNFTYTGSVVTHNNPSGLAKLDVKGSVGGGALGASISVRNTNSANNGSGEFQFQDPGSNIFAKIAGINLTDSSNNGYMTFHTSSATSGLVERLRINSNGDVTTTGQASFDRQNAGFTARKGDSVSITRASGTPLEINRTGSDGQMISLFDDNTQEAAISLDSGSLVFGLPNSSDPHLAITSLGVIKQFASGGDNQFVTKRTGATSSNGDYFFHLTANNNSDTTVGQLGFYRDSANDDARFSVKTRNPGGSITERLQIDSLGRASFSKNSWVGNDMSFSLTVHTGATSETGPVPDGIMIVSQQNSGNQNSTTGKLMFCGHAQTNGPFLYGDNTQAYGKKDLVFHTHSTANDYTTQLEETARFTRSGYFGLGTDTTVDSLMHIQGNSDSGDESCQLTIEDEDTTAGSRVPSVQFKGNGANTWRIRGTDLSGFQFHSWNGSSQIERSIIGNPSEGGAFLLDADDRGWATFRHNHNQGLRTHIRQHYAPGNAVSTYSIMRIRRHNWGWGTYKIRLKALYYYGSQETTYYVNGNGAGGNDNYSIVKETAHNNDWSGATVTKSAASTSSPGNSSTSYIDVKVNVPNYMYMIIYIEAYTSQYSTDPSNVGADSYCLL